MKQEDLYNLLPERVDHWLTQWARFMRHPGLRLGYPVKALSFSGGGESQRWADWAEDEESKIWKRNVVAMSALIEDLVPAQRIAVNHVYLGMTARFERNNLIDLIQSAAECLLIGMEKRAIL